MTPEELEAIEVRANAATPGPWISGRVDDLWRIYHQVPGDRIPVADIVISRLGFSSPEDARDSAFIASARTDVPRLIAALREAWREAKTDLHERSNDIDALETVGTLAKQFAAERDAARAAYKAEHERYLGVARESGAEIVRLRAALCEVYRCARGAPDESRCRACLPCTELLRALEGEQ